MIGCRSPAGVTLSSYAALRAIVAGVMLLVALGYGAPAKIVRKLFSGAAPKARIDRMSGAMMVGEPACSSPRAAAT